MANPKSMDEEAPEVERLEGLDDFGFDFDQFLRPKVPWKPRWSPEEVFSAHGYRYVGRAFTSSERLFRCQRASDDQPCLVKVVDPKEATTNRLLLTNSVQPFPVLGVFDVEETDDVLLVMAKWDDQWCTPDLLEPGRVLSELSHQLATLHSLGVAHLDIHDKNVVAKDGVYVLVDFGSSVMWDGKGPKPLVHDIRTALWSVVPEMKKGSPFDPFPFDIWTLGELFSQIMQICKCETPELKRLIAHMKSEDPLQRPTAAELELRLTDVLRKG